jgi:hypothetical protein
MKHLPTFLYYLPIWRYLSIKNSRYSCFLSLPIFYFEFYRYFLQKIKEIYNLLFYILFIPLSLFQVSFISLLLVHLSSTKRKKGIHRKKTASFYLFFPLFPSVKIFLKDNFFFSQESQLVPLERLHRRYSKCTLLLF